MYTNILVAYDDSDYSRAALKEAALWTKKHKAQLTVVHAVYFDEEEFSAAPEQREKRLGFGSRICSQTKEMLRADFGIAAEALISEGEAPEVIIQTAKERNIELIVMGTHGRRGLKRLIMGSVTSRVIVQAPCDVLVVKRPCLECTGSFSSILVPFDGSDFSRKALKRSFDLVKTDSAEITVLYVIPRYEEMVGFFKTEAIRQRLLEEAQKILDKAEIMAKEAGISLRVEVTEGQTSDEIVTMAARLKSDLIVMGTYGWKGVNKAIMGSTTERIIMGAESPVLAVR